MWEPVLARQKAPGSAALADTPSERKTGPPRVVRAGRRRTIHERLARTNELYIEGHLKKADFEERIAELGSEQHLLDFAPKPSRIAEQRDRLRSIVQDWTKMDDEEQQRLLRFVFRGICASYDRKTGLSMSFDVRPEWQPLRRRGASGGQGTPPWGGARGGGNTRAEDGTQGTRCGNGLACSG